MFLWVFGNNLKIHFMFNFKLQLMVELEGNFQQTNVKKKV